MNAAAIFLAAALLFSPARAGAENVRVLASFLPMYIFARNVTGDTPGVSVDLMLPASLGCPHEYALTPGDMRKIAAADLFIANGQGMESFLGAPVRKANPRVRIVETAAAVPVIRDGDGHAEVNPHTWVSPGNAIIQVRAVEKALSEAHPAGAPSFKRNADAYVARLSALAREVDAAAASVRGRGVVTSHNVFGYLARDLGLEVVGEIEEASGQEMSAGEAMKLIRVIRERKAAAVLWDPQSGGRLAGMIAREAGVPSRMLDPLTTGSTALSAYEDVMRKNLRTLAEVLSKR